MALARREVPDISSDESVGHRGHGNLDEHDIDRVGETDPERERLYPLAVEPDELEDIPDLIRWEPEFWPEEYLLVLDEDPVVEGRAHLAGKHQVKNSAGRTLAAKEGGNQDIGI